MKNKILLIICIVFLLLGFIKTLLVISSPSPKKIEDKLRYAENLYGEKAIQAYEVILQQCPEEKAIAAQAQLGIGLVYYWHIKDIKKARQEFKKVIKLFPKQKDKTGQAAYWIASINKTNNPAQAIDYYEIAIENLSPQEQVYKMAKIGLASTYAAMGDFESTIEVYQNFYKFYGLGIWAEPDTEIDLEAFNKQFSDLSEASNIVTAYKKVLQKHPLNKKECLAALFKTGISYRHSLKQASQSRRSDNSREIYSSKQDVILWSSVKSAIESAIAMALDLYETDNGNYPSTHQGLKALIEKPLTEPTPTNWKGPYINEENLRDPWGNVYVYIYPGIYNKDGFDLYSAGKNGIGDGKDTDDITNWH